MSLSFWFTCTTYSDGTFVVFSRHNMNCFAFAQTVGMMNLATKQKPKWHYSQIHISDTSDCSPCHPVRLNRVRFLSHWWTEQKSNQQIRYNLQIESANISRNRREKTEREVVWAHTHTHTWKKKKASVLHSLVLMECTFFLHPFKLIASTLNFYIQFRFHLFYFTIHTFEMAKEGSSQLKTIVHSHT